MRAGSRLERELEGASARAGVGGLSCWGSVMQRLRAPRTPRHVAAHTAPQAAERSDLIVIVLAVTLALLVDFAVYVFMASH